MTVGGMDSFFMSSAQFVYRNLCRAIASEFNKGPVNKIDKNIHDKVAHFRVEFGTISTVNLTSNFERFKTCFAHVCSLYNFVYAKVFHNFITNYNLGFGNLWVFIRKQCALTLSYNISTAIFKHQIKQSIEIK